MKPQERKNPLLKAFPTGRHEPKVQGLCFSQGAYNGKSRKSWIFSEEVIYLYTDLKRSRSVQTNRLSRNIKLNKQMKVQEVKHTFLNRMKKEEMLKSEGSV